MKKYVLVIDGEVGPDIRFEETSNDETQALAAAMSSDPKVIEIPHDSPVTIGWTWDGTNFIEPSK